MSEGKTIVKNKTCVFSKSKYYEIEKQIEINYPEESGRILDIIKTVLEFDPKISTYNAKVKASIDKRIKRLKYEGISTYISCGRKASYEKKKLLKAIVI